jgi:nicotinate-nucleotide adenylyltransferase
MLSGVRRGILGGTFDPLHVVHLMAADAARADLDLDVVHFVVAGDPWQKRAEPVSDKKHRWEMTTRGVAGIEGFLADDRELERPGPTYTIDTLATFDDDDDIVLILGADAAAGLPTWHEWERVVGRVTVAVVSRPGVAEEEVAASGIDYVWLDTPGIPISSSMLRARVGAGHSIRFFVPDPVWAYVVDEGLYAN